MKGLIYLLLIILVSGCATTAKYDTKLNTWIGVSEDTLIASWGVPDLVYDMSDGKKAIAYVHKDTIRTGGSYRVPETTVHSGKIGNKPYSGTSTQYVTEIAPFEKYKLYCKTSFIIDSSGKVESWHHDGNNCVSH
ncbi:hypothetical protein ACFL1D_05905 [Candidatus Omnitrophota bacterium]